MAAPVERFLAALASQDPTPGGGAVAALGTAMAAGLTAMTASFSESVLENAAAARVEAEEICDRVAELAAQDSRAYSAVLLAMRLPRDDPVRTRAVREALTAASEVPLRVAEAARRVNELACLLFNSGNRNLRGDAVTAAHFSAAAARSAAALVRFNLSDGNDPRVLHADELAAGCVVPESPSSTQST